MSACGPGPGPVSKENIRDVRWDSMMSTTVEFSCTYLLVFIFMVFLPCRSLGAETDLFQHYKCNMGLSCWFAGFDMRLGQTPLCSVPSASKTDGLVYKSS